LPKDISGAVPAPGARRHLPASLSHKIMVRPEYSLRYKVSQAVLGMHRAPADPDSVYQGLLATLAGLPGVQSAGIWRTSRSETEAILLHQWPEGVSYDGEYPSSANVHCTADLEGGDMVLAIAVLLPEGSPTVRFARQTMCGLSRHAVIALNQRHHLLASERTAVSLEVLNHIGNKIVSALNLGDLFHTIYNELRQIMTAHVFYVALYDAGKQEVDMAFIYEEGQSAKPFRFPLNDGPVSRVIKSREAALYNVSISDIPQAIMFGRSQKDVRCLMMAPMMTKGRIVGVISVQSYASGEYTEQDLQLLGTVAGQAAVAVENSRMYERTLRQASTDAMTGLLNRQSFFAHLNTAIASASQLGKSLSLIMVDSDSLKSINDQYGHRAGDEHISHMASVIRDSVRNRDAVCRYGGDEFLILLYDKSATEAAEVAQRIIEAIAAESQPGSVPSMRGTASAGVAEYPCCGTTATALFQAADVAVYGAKRRGKNQVCLAADLARDEVAANAH
jgi:diguanylate cyclase (GGDEF)-like protein